jgi:hypothetical protein
VVDHAGWGDETMEVEMAIGHGSLASTAARGVTSPVKARNRGPASCRAGGHH